jgi:hypothetical protein
VSGCGNVGETDIFELCGLADKIANYFFALGWGLYWYKYDNEDWKLRNGDDKALGELCLDYYCLRLQL